MECMFCHQCEQTPTGGCKIIGVYGKKEKLRDSLLLQGVMHQVKAGSIIGSWQHPCRLKQLF
jgi:hypothetical protein